MTVRDLLKRDLAALGCDTHTYPNDICVRATPFIVLSLLLHAGWTVEPRPPVAQCRGRLLYGIGWLRLKKKGYKHLVVPLSTPDAHTDMLIGLGHQTVFAKAAL